MKKQKRAGKAPMPPTRQGGQMADRNLGLDAETRKRIEEGLQNWHEDKSEARQRFKKAKRKLDEQFQHVTDALEASERLTERDLAFRINTLGTR